MLGGMVGSEGGLWWKWWDGGRWGSSEEVGRVGLCSCFLFMHYSRSPHIHNQATNFKRKQNLSRELETLLRPQTTCSILLRYGLYFYLTYDIIMKECA